MAQSETLKIYEERDIIGHVRSVAPAFQDALHTFAGQPLVGETRGVGLVGAIELVADKRTRAPFDPALKIVPRVAKAARAHGLVTRAMGDTMGFSPPLVITVAEAREMFRRFGAALDQVTDEIAQPRRAA